MKNTKPNNLFSTALTLGAPALALLPIKAPAATDFFLKIDGIDGEAQDSSHKDWIEILSWNWGVSQPVDPDTHQPAGSSTTTDLVLIKELDKSSPKLFAECADGTAMTSPITFKMQAQGVGGKFEYLQLTLHDVIVTSYSTCSGLSSTTQGERPTESFSLNFTKVEWTYVPSETSGGGTEPIQVEHTFSSR